MKNNLLKRFFLTFSVLLFCLYGQAQVTVLNTNINSYNVTPQSLCHVNVMNYAQEMDVIMETRLTNSGNEPLLIVKTQPFRLKKGMNNLSGYAINLSSIEYGSSNQAGYIKNSHVLPSGKFNYCCVIMPVNAESGDDYCEDIEADLTSFLYLISPEDRDTIEAINPMMIWTHSESFNLLAPGEYFRIIVTELNPDQNPESGVTANVPVYMKNYLSTHQVQYPFDAKELEKGKRYGWQVQKFSNGIIINKSEAWEFTIVADKPVKENKYAALKKILDGGYYTVENDRVFFKFEEEYASGNISCLIYNSKREAIKPKAKNEVVKNAVLNFKQNGYNRYEINLNDLDIEQGFHVLEVKNEKGELTFLKFYVQ